MKDSHFADMKALETPETIRRNALDRIAPALILYPEKAKRFRGLPGIVATPCHSFGGGHSLRSSYEVTVNGVRRALVGYQGEGGRGYITKGWRLYSLRASLTHLGTRQMIRPHEVRVGLESLRAAVALVPGLLANGFLPLAEEVVEVLIAADAKNDQAAAERAARTAAEKAAGIARAEEAARRAAETLEALSSIRDRLSGELTNFEAAGLENAISVFTTRG